MITADEARELSGVDPEKLKAHLEYIDYCIRLAADKHLREVIIRDQPYANWVYDRQGRDITAKEVVKTLETNGFDISCYYKVHSVACDIGMWIKW